MHKAGGEAEYHGDTAVLFTPLSIN